MYSMKWFIEDICFTRVNTVDIFICQPLYINESIDITLLRYTYKKSLSILKLLLYSYLLSH